MTTITHDIHKDVHGWFCYGDLYSQIVADPKNIKLVEIGSWQGKSAAYMAVEIALSGRDIEFYCVDTWEGSIEHKNDAIVKENRLFDVFQKNIEPLKQYIKPIRKASLEAVKDFEDDSLDFVFVDASHEYEDVKADLKAWWSKVKENGVFAGHDYITHKPVNKAVNEFAETNNLIAKHISKNSWQLLRK